MNSFFLEEPVLRLQTYLYVSSWSNKSIGRYFFNPISKENAKSLIQFVPLQGNKKSRKKIDNEPKTMFW
jgi:hypothetical protein